MKKAMLMLLLSSIPFAVSAQTPQFFPPETLKSSGVNIDVGYYGSPYVYDWDGDGKKDLLVGQFHYGKVRFYRNTGTNNNPVFSGYEFLKADGSDITVSWG
ncbi:MAG TPA: VCBS repeat-containing protein [bacterium (Candidatus Stahlbacteria)]|nr:VCBS repeat-containing protein [Candidatus Stahlbacteria bacterium]